MLGGNDYGRWHWVAESKLDFNARDGSTDRGAPTTGPHEGERTFRAGRRRRRVGLELSAFTELATELSDMRVDKPV